ncbi:hypothetical protein HK405_011607, partial [Cladochytrium tenue]
MAPSPPPLPLPAVWLPLALRLLVRSLGRRGARPHLAAVALVARAWAAEASPLLYERVSVHLTPSAFRALPTDDIAPLVTMQTNNAVSEQPTGAGTGYRSEDSGSEADSDCESEDQSEIPYDRRRYLSFVPTPDEILSLMHRRMASDMVNPLAFVRHLELLITVRPDFLYDLFRAMARAGAQLKHISIKNSMITTEMLEVLRPLVGTTTSLVLSNYSIDNAARGPFLEHFSGGLAEITHDTSVDADFVSSLVAANAGTLKAFTYVAYYRVRDLHGFEGVSSLRHLSLAIRDAEARSFIESVLLKRCENLKSLALMLYVSDDPLDTILSACPCLRSLEIMDWGIRKSDLLVPDDCPPITKLSLGPGQHSPATLISRLIPSIEALGLLYLDRVPGMET